MLRHFSVGAASGLTYKKAHENLKKYGYNSISSHQVVWWEVFLRQFTSAFIYLLVGAGLLALFLGETLDGLLIFGFVFINALISFFQEYRSEQTLKLLKRHTSFQTLVLRQGEWNLLPSTFLVAGDIIQLKAGDIIPADVRFLETNNVVVNESVLTGESVPIYKVSQALHCQLPLSLHTLSLNGLG